MVPNGTRPPHGHDAPVAGPLKTRSTVVVSDSNRFFRESGFAAGPDRRATFFVRTIRAKAVQSPAITPAQAAGVRAAEGG